MTRSQSSVDNLFYRLSMPHLVQCFANAKLNGCAKDCLTVAPLGAGVMKKSKNITLHFSHFVKSIIKKLIANNENPITLAPSDSGNSLVTTPWITIRSNTSRGINFSRYLDFLLIRKILSSSVGASFEAQVCVQIKNGRQPSHEAKKVCIFIATENHDQRDYACDESGVSKNFANECQTVIQPHLNAFHHNLFPRSSIASHVTRTTEVMQPRGVAA